MKITAIDHYLPEHTVTHEQTIDLFRRHSEDYHDADSLESILEVVSEVLRKMGHRQIRVRAEGERWFERFLERTRAMLARTDVDINEIDKVVYVATGRGHREPALAYSLAHHLGITRAECFDVLDACSGWSRAANLLEPHFILGRCRHALILSLEFNRTPLLGLWAGGAERGYHPIYSIRDPEELEWRVFGSTVGEAGTATLLSAGGDPWYIDYVSDTAQHRCCGFLLANHEDYDLAPSPAPQHHEGEELFFSFGRQIGREVRQNLVRMLREPAARRHLEEAKLVVPHSLSKGLYEQIFADVGVAERAIHPFETCGNVVSSGIPLGLSLAVHSGRLHRGDRVVLAPSGAGNSYGVLSFKF